MVLGDGVGLVVGGVGLVVEARACLVRLLCCGSVGVGWWSSKLCRCVSGCGWSVLLMLWVVVGWVWWEKSVLGGKGSFGRALK